MKITNNAEKIFCVPETKYNFLSLGAGVQSSTMALMAAKGEITPMPDAAIFADTQAEPQEVYDWLEWLITQLPFPVHIVTAGNLVGDAIFLKTKKDGLGKWYKRLVPFFTKNKNDGSIGKLNRGCTFVYKIKPIIKKQRSLAEIKRAQKECTVTSWIGISWDEIQRVKYSRHKWVQHRWPLLEKQMKRADCKRWMTDNGYPEPPRSACWFCPYHSDSEWMRLKNESPREFLKAVEFEEDFQIVKEQVLNKTTPYLHRSCIPLDQVDFSKPNPNQLNLWDEECDGMCGM